MTSIRTVRPVLAILAMLATCLFLVASARTVSAGPGAPRASALRASSAAIPHHGTSGGDGRPAVPPVLDDVARAEVITWRWPLAPVPAVLRPFQVGPAPWSPGHRGADLAAGAGESVLAPADGVVSFAGMVAGRAVLSLDVGGGYITSFEPVTTHLARGATARAGEAVAAVSGVPGHCTPRACLHWGVRKNGQYVDPLALVGWRPPVIVLLPLPG